MTRFQLFASGILITLMIILSYGFTFTEKQAWQLFDKQGNPVSYSAMAEKLIGADVIFFGELHNNTISHWLQLELTIDLYRADTTALFLGAEMFERDNQLILDEYLLRMIRERDFEAEARLWRNYKTDYKPLVTFAHEHRIPFIATNIPRRYAALVHSRGFEGLEDLTDEAKRYFAPLPVPYDPELPGYAAMAGAGSPAMHAGSNLPKAQAIKDATMAWSIVEHWQPGKRFLHFNGSYHSDNDEGILWYLRHYKPGLKVMTISTVEQSQVQSLDTAFVGRADYILVVNERVTKTY
jgi:uncharacterized iron-regulated protein